MTVLSHSLPPKTLTWRWVDPPWDFRHFRAVFFQALPDFVKHGVCLKWLIDKAQVLFTDAVRGGSEDGNKYCLCF